MLHWKIRTLAFPLSPPPLPLPLPFHSHLQTMDVLKRKLVEYDVDYTEKVFATSKSIGGLQPNPFVSIIALILQ